MTLQQRAFRTLKNGLSKKLAKGDTLVEPGFAAGQSGRPWCVYRTSDIHDVVRASGLMTTAYSTSSHKVFARGQACPCVGGRMLPAIARGLDDKEAMALERRVDTLVRIRDAVRNALPNNSRFEDSIILAVLQHYGIRTHWLDVVDNLFVALWFASNSRTLREPYAFVPLNAPGHLFFLQVEDSGQVTDAWEHGHDSVCQGGKDTKWCDLRRQHTSLSLRPHAQHGILISRRCHHKPDTVDVLDMTRTVLAEIEFPADSKIMRFMAEDRAGLMSWMFPPTGKDDTYGRLRRQKVLDAVASVLGSRTGDMGGIDLYR